MNFLDEIPAQKLYDAYKKWCEEVGEEYPCNQIIFSSRLQERSIKKKPTKAGNVYLDVHLKEYTLVPRDLADF